MVILKASGVEKTKHLVLERLEELHSITENPTILTVDMPIGLLDLAKKGGRPCDIEARALLGQPRARSVFSPPVRAAIEHDNYETANKANIESSPLGIGISKQSHSLRGKLIEVDEFITPELQQSLIREIHPELCFYELNGKQPMKFGKKSPAGWADRRKSLIARGYGPVIEEAQKYPRSQVAEDDILDACVACWTAERIATGKAIRIPSEPQEDSRGLLMEMWR